MKALIVIRGGVKEDIESEALLECERGYEACKGTIRVTFSQNS